MNKQMQTFSFNPSINLAEEFKCLFGLSSLECTNSAVKITNGNKSFSIIIPSHCQTEFGEKKIKYLSKLLELKSLELHVEPVRKRGKKVRIGDDEYKLSDFDTQTNEILEEL